MTDQLKISAKLYIINMRSTAQVCEITLIVYCDIAIFQIRDQIQLVLIILEHFHGFFLGNLPTDDLLAGFGNFLHFLFNVLDVFITNYIITKINIIIETFCNNRSYPEFGIGIQMLDCLCHQMCTGVVQCVQSFVFFEIYHCFNSPFPYEKSTCRYDSHT